MNLAAIVRFLIEVLEVTAQIIDMILSLLRTAAEARAPLATTA